MIDLFQIRKYPKFYTILLKMKIVSIKLILNFTNHLAYAYFHLANVSINPVIIRL